MAALHGTIGEFDSTREDWCSYIERLQQYFSANDVTDVTKQRAILLSVCGPSTYKLMRNLVAPSKPSDCSFAELADAVHKHHEPRPSIIVQRFKFNTCSRREGESVASFVAELRRLTEHCEFGPTLDDMLRDRLVCGINESTLQRRLLAQDKLTFQTALEMAQAWESAGRHVQDLQSTQSGQQPTQDVHAVRQHRSVRHERSDSHRPASNSANPCNSCGGPHSRASCRHRSAVCNYCGKKGHLARVCRGKLSKEKSSTPRAADKASTHQLEVRDAEPQGDEYPLFTIASGSMKPVVVTVLLNGKEVDMEVDTGAAISLISASTYRTLWPADQAPELLATTIKLRTYTREAIEVLGAIEVDVYYTGQQERLHLLVVAGDGPSLIGRDWLRKIRLNWKELNLVRCSPDTPSPALAEVLDRHTAVFASSLGTVRGVTAKIHADPSHDSASHDPSLTLCAPR